MKKFIPRMMTFEKNAVDYYNNEKRLIVTPNDINEFKRAMKCRFCHGPFEYYPHEKGQDIKYKDKVRDHDHLTGSLRGAAHSACNLRHSKTLKIPIFFHNFRAYDAHLIASHLVNIDDRQICVIDHVMEKYLTLYLGKILTFNLSLELLGAPLEQIGKNLRASGMDKFKLLRPEFTGATNDQVDLLLRKQLYTHEYMDSWECFMQCSLPTKEAFYNKLRGQALSDEEYAHAQIDSSTFGLQDGPRLSSHLPEMFVPRHISRQVYSSSTSSCC